MFSLSHLRRALHLLYSSFYRCGTAETAGSRATVGAAHLFAAPAGCTRAQVKVDEAALAFPATAVARPKSAYRRGQRGQRYSFLTYSGGLRQVDG